MRKILDIDIENRPLVYQGSDYVLCQITGICSCWALSPSSLKCWLLGRDKVTDMLESFLLRYKEADIVTGHNIRRHDLPIINGTMMEYGMKLTPKLTCDTYADCLKHASSFSASQENLAAFYKISRPKVHMTSIDWGEANRLTKKGLELTYKRVVGDVLQHMQLRIAMVKADALRCPKEWRP